MKIRIKKRIELQHIWMWLGLFCVVSFALLEHVSVSIPAFSAVKMPLMYVGGICVIFQMNELLSNIRKKRYFYIFLLLLLMFVFLLISMFHNRNTISGFALERTTVRLILYLLELFGLMLVFAENGKSSAAIKLIYYYVLILVVLTDVLMFSGLVRFGSENNPNYLIGTKFSVVYMHLNLVALWLVQQWRQHGINRIKKWLIWGTAIILVLVAIGVNCMSGVLGACFFAIMLVGTITGKRIARLLTSPSFFVICVLICTVIVFVISFFLNIPFIKNFIENVLDRSTTLTGRTDIYLNYADAMRNNWLLGYGYGSGNAVSLRFFHLANAQNAVLHWILQGGLIVSALLISLFAMVINQVNEYRKTRKMLLEPVIALVYTYVLLGTVETTYSMSFILWIALMFMVVNDKTNRDS